MGLSWGDLRASWGHLVPSWGPLGGVLWRLGGVLGRLGGQDPTRARGLRFLEASWGRLGAPGGPSWGLLGPSWPSWRPLDPVLGPSWRPKSDLKSLPKSIILWITFLINFSMDFGSIFDRFSTPKSIKNRSKIDLRSEQAQIRGIFKFIGRGGGKGPGDTGRGWGR